MTPIAKEPLGLYLAIPFCKAKCTFCNFASDAFGPAHLDAYIDRLCNEIHQAHETAGRLGRELPRLVDTVYLGGGTPSLLRPMHIRKLFTALRAEFDLAPEPEITLECAPGQLADDSLAEFQRNGVNRISFGVQSFQEEELRAAGRLHTADQSANEIARVQSAGITAVGLDLIAGLPHQTVQSWKQSVERAIDTGVTHVSVYMLELDEDSRLGREALFGGVRYGAAMLPSEGDTVEMYLWACDRLERAGLPQYEISNFAVNGFRSRHNQKYWLRQPYLGFGLDAHSMLRMGKSAVRFQNTDDLETYLAESCLPRFAKKPKPVVIDPEGAFEETVFLGLRRNEGICLELLRQEYGDIFLERIRAGLREATDAHWITVEGSKIRLTNEGRVLSNEVFSRLLLPVAA